MRPDVVAVHDPRLARNLAGTAPLSCSILYIDRRDRSLRAFDRVTVDGLGGTGARIERKVLSAPEP